MQVIGHREHWSGFHEVGNLVVLNVLLPQVAREPGIKQAATYALFPAVDPEWLRDALYNADVLGKLQRRKKGNTYTLWPADGQELQA